VSAKADISVPQASHVAKTKARAEKATLFRLVVMLFRLITNSLHLILDYHRSGLVWKIGKRVLLFGSKWIIFPDLIAASYYHRKARR
jgi:hypothetical protein